MDRPFHSTDFLFTLTYELNAAINTDAVASGKNKAAKKLILIFITDISHEIQMIPVLSAAIWTFSWGTLIPANDKIRTAIGDHIVFKSNNQKKNIRMDLL